VVLLDTLAEGLPHAQVEAVTAHELGHLNAGHLRRRFLLLSGIWLIATASAWFIAAAAFDPVTWKQLTAALVLVQPLRFLMQPLLTARLRTWEFQADAFAARHVLPADLCAALRTLLGLNSGTMGSDPWFAAFHDSHPPLPERLRRLSGM
jgi:STE24 endopeptidase